MVGTSPFWKGLDQHERWENRGYGGQVAEDGGISREILALRSTVAGKRGEPPQAVVTIATALRRQQGRASFIPRLEKPRIHNRPGLLPDAPGRWGPAVVSCIGWKSRLARPVRALS